MEHLLTFPKVKQLTEFYTIVCMSSMVQEIANMHQMQIGKMTKNTKMMNSIKPFKYGPKTNQTAEVLAPKRQRRKPCSPMAKYTIYLNRAINGTSSASVKAGRKSSFLCTQRNEFLESKNQNRERNGTSSASVKAGRKSSFLCTQRNKSSSKK